MRRYRCARLSLCRCRREGNNGEGEIHLLGALSVHVKRLPAGEGEQRSPGFAGSLRWVTTIYGKALNRCRVFNLLTQTDRTRKNG